MTTVLITGATGDTGTPTVKALLTKGVKVRALAHREDSRSQTLADLGAEVIYGDITSLRDIRQAFERKRCGRPTLKAVDFRDRRIDGVSAR